MVTSTFFSVFTGYLYNHGVANTLSCCSVVLKFLSRLLPKSNVYHVTVTYIKGITKITLFIFHVSVVSLKWPWSIMRYCLWSVVSFSFSLSFFLGLTSHELYIVILPCWSELVECLSQHRDEQGEGGLVPQSPMIDEASCDTVREGSAQQATTSA